MKTPIKRPALQYFGGKWILAEWIIQHFPAHKAYLEPFGGACSVLLKKKPSPIEVYNDLNGDIVNYFKVLRERPSDLLNVLELTPYSRSEFENCKDLTIGDEVERARRFYVRSWQGRSFGGQVDAKNTWRVYCNPDDTSHTLAQSWVIPENLYAISSRLRNAQIENTDAFKLIEKYDKAGLLIYADPPYELSTRSELRYKHDTSYDFQKSLADILTSCKSMVVLSGYRCPQYDEWYKDWKRVDRKVSTQAINIASNERGSAVESIWSNPAAQSSQQSLFTP